jgi:hypothetical protein
MLPAPLRRRKKIKMVKGRAQGIALQGRVVKSGRATESARNGKGGRRREPSVQPNGDPWIVKLSQTDPARKRFRFALPLQADDLANQLAAARVGAEEEEMVPATDNDSDSGRDTPPRELPAAGAGARPDVADRLAALEGRIEHLNRAGRRQAAESATQFAATQKALAALKEALERAGAAEAATPPKRARQEASAWTSAARPAVLSTRDARQEEEDAQLLAAIRLSREEAARVAAARPPRRRRHPGRQRPVRPRPGASSGSGTRRARVFSAARRWHWRRTAVGWATRTPPPTARAGRTRP